MKEAAAKFLLSVSVLSLLSIVAHLHLAGPLGLRGCARCHQIVFSNLSSFFAAIAAASCIPAYQEIVGSLNFA